MPARLTRRAARLRALLMALSATGRDVSGAFCSRVPQAAGHGREPEGADHSRGRVNSLRGDLTSRKLCRCPRAPWTWRIAAQSQPRIFAVV